MILLFLLVSLLITNCAGLLFDTSSFDVLETNHFTFFYKPGSIVEKDLSSIVKYSELAVKWYFTYTNVSVTVKPDVYLFDEGTGGDYNRVAGLLDDSVLDSNSTKGVITYYYKENNYIETSVTILHETIHVIQDYILELNSIGIAEGYTSYLALKYYFYILGNTYSDESIFALLSSYITDDLEKYGEYPSHIFSMSLVEFNGVMITENGIERKPLKRYEISESFIVYLTMKYDISYVNNWLKQTDTINFKARFKEEFKVDFDVEEKNWYEKVSESYEN